MSENPLSTPASRFRWDVFLSFRGEDTRDNFTNGLYSELERNGVRVFRDNDGMNKGDSLDPTLFEAIEDSAASIAIISPNYASSRWCLEELATIWECRRLILPVFYQVDPSDVRRQTGPFEDHLRSHQQRFGEDMVRKWRNAMKNVGGKSGWVFQNGDQEQLIFLIVKNVLDALRNTPIMVSPYTVGLDFPLKEVMELLDAKCKGIRVLGLHGMGGIGKTTLSKALFNKLVSHIEHRSFVSNVRETFAKQDGILHLQNKLIQDLSSSSSSSTGGVVAQYVKDVNAGISVIKRIIHEKKVLIVLDDIDDVKQLDALAVVKEWFYEGSRIIISTRDKKVLSTTNLVTDIYEVKELGESDSIKLFSYHALRREKPTTEFSNLSKQIVSLTGRLPLALEVFGSFLIDKRTVKEWDDALQKLKTIRPSNLQDVLKLSFNGLDEQEKCIFLDIACLFLELGMSRDEVIDVIKGCGFSAETNFRILVERSLVKVSDYGDDSLRMHDQIRDMGRQIVLTENLVDPRMRSRLWDHAEILGVLHAEGTRNTIQGITLNIEKKSSPKDTTTALIGRRTSNEASALKYMKEMYKKYFQRGAEEEEKEVVVCTTKFKPMVNLRLLQLGDVRLEGDFRHMPCGMKWLQWRKCPLKSLPSYFLPKLTVLDLSQSNIQRLWNTYSNKVAKNLIVLDLHGCHNLTSLPNLSGNPCLEKLNLELCTKLATIDKSIGDLNSLRTLNLRGCSCLVEFPSDVSGLKRLETLILSGCRQLKELPENTGCMISLRQLLMDETAIWSFPESIFRLTKLETLSLNRCESLKRLPFNIGKLDSLREFSLDSSALEEIPNSIGLLRNLEKLSLMWCKSLNVIPDSIGNLKLLTEFRINRSSVKELPASIGSLYYLKGLSVGHCCDIITLPVSIERLASMVELDLDGTSIEDLPEQIGGLKSLKKLEMRDCKSLRSLPVTIQKLLSLNTLIITNTAIVELPESLGMLEDLIMLNLNKCRLLRKLPDSFGKLKNLHHLLMEETSVANLPENFGMLSSLMILKMAKKTDQEMPRFVELPTSFSNLSMLKEFDARRWKISGKIPDDFEKLSSLEILKMDHNDFCSLPSSMVGLSNLTQLKLSNCKQLKVVPPLPSSLLQLNATNCIALESISDMSNLESLEDLLLTNCDKLQDIPGLECLKSLKRLYAGGCNLCSSAIKQKLNKVALRNLYYLSMPGSEIPNLFTPKEVIYSKRKNNALTALIFGVVVSINHEIADDRRDQIPAPAIVDIQAKILRSNIVVCTSVLNLLGEPNTDKDQFYLCRYQEHDGFFLMLEDGDKIEVSMLDPPFIKGVELKKCGVHLIYENDDDYTGDEESLDESQQSVSHILKNFLGSSKEVELKSGPKVEREVEEVESIEERAAFNCRNSLLVLLLFSCLIVLLLCWVAFV